MLLIQEEIRRLSINRGLINPFHGDNAQGASYDMRLGEKCYISSSPGSNDGIVLLEDNKEITIPKNTIFMFQTMEKLTLPLNLVGKLSLRMGLIRQGLIMPSQPQIDAGYDNYVFGMLYNLSNRDIILKRGDHIASVEFYKLHKEVEPYRDHYQNYSLADYVAHHVQSSMDYLNEKMDDSIKRIRRSQETIEFQKQMITGFSIVLAFIALGMTVFAIYLSVNPLSDAKNNIERNRSNVSAVKSTMQDLTSKVDCFDSQWDQRVADIQTIQKGDSQRLYALESRMIKLTEQVKTLQSSTEK